METQVGAAGKQNGTPQPTTLPRPAAAPARPDDAIARQGPDRRQNRIDRRTGLERRQATAQEAGYTGPERRRGKERRDETGLERRRGPGRRRSDERREAEEGEMNAQQFEFVMAIEAYKKVNKRLYPTWTEILEIFLQLGYRKVLNRTVTMNVPEPALFNGEEEPKADYDSGEPDSFEDLEDSED